MIGGAEAELLAGLVALVRRTTIGLIVLLTLGLGIVWTAVNFYNYYPLIQARLENAVTRLSTRDDNPETGSEFIYPLRTTDGTSVGSKGECSLQPTISVLVPAYEEADVVKNSIRSIYEATYPTELLDVCVLVEPDDAKTQAALSELAEEFPFEILVVPTAYPGGPNKPRALNYGFEHVDGEVIGVVDAEVIIGENTFERLADEIVNGADFALSHLDMVNEDDGWLNLLFRAEYGYWYEEVVPAFAQIGYPVPLGGTSCFFRQGVLKEISRRRHEQGDPSWSTIDRLWLFEHGLDGAVPWDPENVTEDFELGLELWVSGYEFAYLDSISREESPLDLQGWMVQRTRWKQGKLYTFRKYIERPPRSLRQRFHLYWQSLLPHLGPINIGGLIFVLWLANMSGAVPSALVGGILALGLAFLVMVSLLYAWGYWLVSEKPIWTRIRRTVIVALTLYFYWILQWIADLRAIQLTYRGQFNWESTTHFGRNLLDRTREEDDVPNSEAGGSVLSGNTTRQDRSDGDRIFDRPRQVVGLLLIVGVAAAVRAAGLTRWSLWLDEIYTITFRAAIPIREALVVPFDPHPPLYFVLVHLWMDLAGRTHVVAGLFSLTFSVATVIAVYAFARQLYDDRTGLIAAALIAVSTMHIHFGRNIRMYSLFTFLSIVSWYTYVRLPDRGRTGDAAYLVATVAMLYTHVYALFVLGAQFVYTLLTETDRQFRQRWWRLQMLVGLAYIPWIVVLGRQVLGRATGSGATAIGWIPAPSTALLRDTLLMYAGFPSFYPIMTGSTATWLAAIAVLFVFNVTLLLSVVFYDDRADEYRLSGLDEASLLGTFFAVPIVVPFIASYVLFPVYFPRFALVASLPLYVLVARGVINLDGHQGWQVAFVAILLIGSVVTGAGYFNGESVEDWRGAVNEIEDEVTPDDLLVIQPFWVENDVNYYYNGVNATRLLLPGSEGMTPMDQRELATLAAEHDTVWLIRYQNQSGGGTIAVLDETYSQSLVYDYGRITILRFERAENTASF
jgi:cellulose synthase/poly-beta-1,6-N-acetylglucosamine synthase-like glycosyltransferase